MRKYSQAAYGGVNLQSIMEVNTMFGFLSKKKKKFPQSKRFKFFVTDNKSEIAKNKWYRLSHWKSPNYLKMETEWDKSWKVLLNEEEVVGVSHENREAKFLILGDQENFHIFLDRDPENPHDPNAIKVMGKATIDGEDVTMQLGFLSKETALSLKDEKEIDARPYSVYLPYEDKRYGLRIRILGRSKAYKKKNG